MRRPPPALVFWLAWAATLALLSWAAFHLGQGLEWGLLSDTRNMPQ